MVGVTTDDHAVLVPGHWTHAFVADHDHWLTADKKMIRAGADYLTTVGRRVSESNYICHCDGSYQGMAG